MPKPRTVKMILRSPRRPGRSGDRSSIRCCLRWAWPRSPPISIPRRRSLSSTSTCSRSTSTTGRGCYVALGGLHVTALPDEAALHADSIFCGSGEETFPAFLQDLAAGCPQPRYASAVRTLEAGYRWAYEEFYRWGSIFRASTHHGSWEACVKSFCYSAAWKKLEPLRDAVIRGVAAAAEDL